MQLSTVTSELFVKFKQTKKRAQGEHSSLSILSEQPPACFHPWLSPSQGLLPGPQTCTQIFSVFLCLLLAQLCLTLCNPMDCSSPGSSVHGFLQAKNTGVGCHSLLQILPVSLNASVVFMHSCSVVSLRPFGLWPTRLLCPWNFSGKNTGVGCHFLLQRIFPTQGLNPHLLHLLHWQADYLSLAPPGLR